MNFNDSGDDLHDIQEEELLTFDKAIQEEKSVTNSIKSCNSFSAKR